MPGGKLRGLDLEGKARNLSRLFRQEVNPVDLSDWAESWRGVPSIGTWCPHSLGLGTLRLRYQSRPVLKFCLVHFWSIAERDRYCLSVSQWPQPITVRTCRAPRVCNSSVSLPSIFSRRSHWASLRTCPRTPASNLPQPPAWTLSMCLPLILSQSVASTADTHPADQECSPDRIMPHSDLSGARMGASRLLGGCRWQWIVIELICCRWGGG